jgi:hypothetical protein
MIADLFQLYDEEPTAPGFVSIDFAGTRTTDMRRMGVIPQVIQTFDAEDEEKYFLHGLNVRPYKRGAEGHPIAEDVCMIECGFNSFGDIYRKPVPVNLPPPDWKTSRVFWSDDYKYHDLSGSREKSRWHGWIDDVYGPGTSEEYMEPNPRLPSRVKRYNFYSLNEELATLSEGVRKSDGALIKERVLKKEIPDEVLTAVKAMRGRT